MNTPLVSIVVPVYNQRPDFLRDCLQGAVSQTYPNIEIIVSDNHSTDGSLEVIWEFKSDRVKIVRPPQHLEIIDHFTFAAGAATGEFISFCSSDDFLYPQCIEKVVKPLVENKQLSFSYCNSRVIDLTLNRESILRDQKMPSGVYKNSDVAFSMYNHSGYWIIGGVMRTEQFRSIGFPKNIRASDWVLGMRLLKYGDVAYVNEVLSAFRFHERQGGEKQAYANAYVLHYKQTIARHELIIQDKELLRAIGLSTDKAIEYRDKQIIGSTIMLVRRYHKGEVTDEAIKDVFDIYRQHVSGFKFNFLMRNYASKIGLGYTYLLGLSGRINKFFSPKKGKL